MPQFEPTWFASQIFWLAIVFYVLYRLLKGQVIPKVAGLLAERESRIQGDLELAQQRRDELEAMQTAYEADLAAARADAQDRLRAAQARMAEKQAAALEKVSQEIAAQVAEAEKRIAAEKDAAMADLRTVAVEVATAATSRLTTGSVDAARVQAAVDANMGAR